MTNPERADRAGKQGLTGRAGSFGARLSWRRRADVRDLAGLRANNLWASGQRVTRRMRRRLRREARRDLTL